MLSYISHLKGRSCTFQSLGGLFNLARVPLLNSVRSFLVQKLSLTRLSARLLGKEYARADIRWGLADPTVVSLEILTVLGVGPLCCYIIYQLIKDDPARHYWIVVISTAELYGGYERFRSSISSGLTIRALEC